MVDWNETQQDRAPGVGSRGDEARERLLEAAIGVFGEQGFAAAGTRTIAEAAGTNPAMISYYFGGKHGLYLAAVRHIAAGIGAHVGPVAARVLAAKQRLDDRPRGAAGVRRRYLVLLWSLLDALIELMAAERSGPWARLILREQQEPSDAFDILYDGIMGPLLELTSELIAMVDGVREVAQEHKIRALTLVGHALVFRAARAATLRLLGWQAVEGDDLTVVKRVARTNLARILVVADEVVGD